MNKTECRSCHAPIVFLRNERGHTIPVSLGGWMKRYVPVVVEESGIVRLPREGEDPNGCRLMDTYVSHMESCPQRVR
jgi:hypothetical protein